MSSIAFSLIQLHSILYNTNLWALQDDVPVDRKVLASVIFAIKTEFAGKLKP